MFGIVCHLLSGSTVLCLTEITLSGSQIFFVRLVGVWQRNFEPAVCVHGTKGWEFQSSTAQYSLLMDRTRSETCWSDF